MRRVRPPPVDFVRPDERAYAEQKAFDEVSLERQARIGDHRHSESKKHLLHHLFGFVLGLVALVFTAAFLIWGLHHLSPYGWLTPEQLTFVDSLMSHLATGVVGATLIDQVKKHTT